MTKIQQTADFTDENIYVGIDVHRKSWTVTLYYDQNYLKRFTQPPTTEVLVKFLRKEYPGANYLCGYESGFSGFWIQRELQQEGVKCFILHAADIPQTHKRKSTKNDVVDSQRIAQTLSSGMGQSIYIPDPVTESDRSLLRYRDKLIRDIRRSKNRIRSFLLYNGYKIPEQFNESWSNKFIQWLKEFEIGYSMNRTTLNHMINQLDLLRKSLLRVNRDIRALQMTEKYHSRIELLTSTPGIGPLSAIIILTEIVDIHRFKSFRQLNSFVGLYPMEYSSGENTYTGKITVRSNQYLRKIFIEAAWVAVRQDPALTLTFNEWKKRMTPKRAIVKIARKLVSRVRYMWLNDITYVKGVIK